MSDASPRRDGTCFYERDPDLPLPRRAAAEGFGTFCLVFAVVSAALMWNAQPASGPIGRALGVGPTLTSLILLFGTVSGGHYNPLISVAQTLVGHRSRRCLAGYLAAQAIGAVLGALMAQAVFGQPLAVGYSPPLVALTSEIFATGGLMTLVLATPRMQPSGVGPFAVGAWVAMTIVALPAAPTANPAITLVMLLCGRPRDAGAAFLHFAAQAVGLAIAFGVTTLTAPRKQLEETHS